MRRLVRTAAVSAAVAALVLPGLALGQEPRPKLVESPSSGVPRPRYLLQLPSGRALTTAAST